MLQIASYLDALLGGSNSTYKMDLWTINTSLKGTDYGEGTNITVNNENDRKVTRVRLVVYNGATLNNLTFKPMLVAGTENKEYEPYGASPSPDYPSKVVCLGSNKNEIGLQEIQETTTNGITYRVENEKIYLNGVSTKASFIDISLKKEINLNNKKVFRAILENIIENNNNKVSLWLSNSENENLVGNLWLSSLDNVLKTTKLDKTATKIRIYIAEAGITFNTEIKTKLEKGEIATSYSPYGQGSTEIKKINNNLLNDEAYKNITITSTSSISSIDYQEFNNLKKNKTYIVRIWFADGTYANDNNLMFYGYNSNKVNIATIPNTVSKTYDNADEIKYIKLQINSGGLETYKNKTIKGIQIEEGNIVTEYEEHQEERYILDIQQEMLQNDYFVKEADGWKEVHNWTKIDSYNSESITTDYISTTGELTTGATIYYKLATPTKLLCTPEQSAVLDELNSLNLFEGVNNIITAENIAKLKLKYVADTKTYVDNQVNERLSNIENQIINLLGGN